MNIAEHGTMVVYNKINNTIHYNSMFFLFFINTYIQQTFIKLIESDSKDIYNIFIKYIFFL